ncbi:YadA-like family protein, partial [Phascolarctobacterium succinatutens]|uniref:YadA-like family protein n=1 Tax=Phascolarctobacterium succinatutens TaxID=626940 RepID=UPI003A8EE228
VNSNGAFYAANGKLVVDKDGKVTATEGEIGNVVLKNGVLYKNTALRDGELFVGDASGNYSQITTKGAKLGKVTVAVDGKISGVAAGAITADSTDAVNGSQLHAVATEAGKHSKVVNGNNTNVEETTVDGQKVYKVNLNNNIMVGDVTGKYVSISGTNGTIEATGYIATKDRVYADKGAKLADIDVTGDTISNGDAKLALNGAAGTAGMINGKGASVYMQDGYTVINSKVAFDQNGKISGVAAGAITADSTDAVNGSQLHAVATEAGKHSKVVNGSNINVEEFDNDGQKIYKVNLNKDIMLGDLTGKNVSISGTNGTIEATGAIATKDRVYADKGAKLADIDVTGDTISNGDAKLALNGAAGTAGMINGKGASVYMQDGYTVINSKVAFDQNGKISGVAAGAVTADSTDAVNGSQLHAVATEAGKHSKVVSGNNINVEETDVDGQKFYKVNMNKDIILGDLTGKYVNISGTNGTIETTGYIATQDRVYADKGAKLADIDVTGNKISNGASSIVLDGSNVKVNDKVTIDQNGKISGVAAGEISSTSTDAINGSQLKETNDRVAANETAIKNNTEAISKLDGRVNANETAIKNNAEAIKNNADAISGLNTRVDDVANIAKQHTTVTAGNNITVTKGSNDKGGENYTVALDKNITVDSVKVGDKTYISDKGLNANDQKVTNVAAGEISATSKDAVNGSQLYASNQEVANNTNRINQLGSRVNKVGAGAAALAALHPMDFDPDDKLTFSAGYGNYGGENAAAIGAYYRPDEKVMFSVGGTVGNGENMVNAGVSFSLDRTNHVSNSRTAMAREILDLRAEVTELKAMVAKGGLGSIAEDKMKIFPDVAENHWAYEYVGKLAAAGIIEGYPDGKFSGDRMMSRYEFAAMLYRAMQKGAQLDSKIINEFAPEMGRIRVDRISGEDGDRDKIERVRVNAVKGERDHYGNKIAKAEAKAK